MAHTSGILNLLSQLTLTATLHGKGSLFNPSTEATHSLREESDSVKMKPLLRQSQDPVFT